MPRRSSSGTIHRHRQERGRRNPAPALAPEFLAHERADHIASGVKKHLCAFKATASARPHRGSVSARIRARSIGRTLRSTSSSNANAPSAAAIRAIAIRNDKQEKTTREYGKLDRRCALMPCGPSAICGFSQPVHAATTTVGDFPLRPRGRIPREAKSPPSAVLRSSLRPARASRVLARLARLLSAAARGTDGMSRRLEETERRNEHP